MLEKTLESLRTIRSNQSVLNEINPEYPLEGLMPELNLQYSGHLRQRADSLEKTLVLRKTEGKKRQGRQRMRWVRQPQRLSGHERLQQTVEDRGAWRATVHGATESDTG